MPLRFHRPAILDGRSPLLVAAVVAATIMLTALYLTHHFWPTTVIAVAGSCPGNLSMLVGSSPSVPQEFSPLMGTMSHSYPRIAGAPS